MDETAFAEDFDPCCDGEVLRVREYRQYILNGYPAGARIPRQVHYQCAKCGSPVSKRSDAAPDVDLLRDDRNEIARLSKEYPDVD